MERPLYQQYEAALLHLEVIIENKGLYILVRPLQARPGLTVGHGEVHSGPLFDMEKGNDILTCCVLDWLQREILFLGSLSLIFICLISLIFVISTPTSFSVRLVFYLAVSCG